MNIYRVYIWGPCDSEEDVQSLRAEGADNVAVVIAPSIDVANQVSYLVAADGKSGQSTYQEIEGFQGGTQCIVEAVNAPRTFDLDIIEGLIQDPILPTIGHSDEVCNTGTLYRADWSRDKRQNRVRFWVYSSDDVTANILVTEHGDQMGLFDLDADSIKIDLFQEERVTVFWGGKMKMYSTTNDNS